MICAKRRQVKLMFNIILDGPRALRLRSWTGKETNARVLIMFLQSVFEE